jgi:hypothetical protein
MRLVRPVPNVLVATAMVSAISTKSLASSPSTSCWADEERRQRHRRYSEANACEAGAEREVHAGLIWFAKAARVATHASSRRTIAEMAMPRSTRCR